MIGLAESRRITRFLFYQWQQAAGRMLRRLAQVSPASSDNNTVPRSFSEWIEFLYGPLFRVIGFFYRTYKANRDRVSAIMAREKVAALMKFLAILFLLGWILVWLFATDESRTRLTDEIKQTIGGFDTGSE